LQYVPQPRLPHLCAKNKLASIVIVNRHSWKLERKRAPIVCPAILKWGEEFLIVAARHSIPLPFPTPHNSGSSSSSNQLAGREKKSHVSRQQACHYRCRPQGQTRPDSSICFYFCSFFIS
jgi:hypothetical protein